MPTLQELTVEQINEAMEGAVQKHLPLTLTAESENRWVNLRSRAIALSAEHLIIEPPTMDDGMTPYELALAEKVGISFKLKHHKHIFSARVAGTATVPLEDATEAAGVRICCPTRMHRLQRRAYIRADVPANRIVRASIWLGGRESEPAGTTADRPVWSGQVKNISAGGFAMRTSKHAAATLDVNDIVGVRMAFGAARETIYADAQFRHAEDDGDMVLMGLQFIGLTQSREGLATLQFISAKVGEFQRADHGVAIAQRQ